MKAVTFGEIMMRLNPEAHLRFQQAEKFEASYAGGEANVAVSLANYGIQAAFVSKVPAHEIGQNAVNALRHFGVETGDVVRGGERLGIYFVEKGASQRASKVIYDRAGSAIALAEPSDFDWNRIFDDTDWFHFTGITPALGGKLPEICLDACKAAKNLGVKVSCDLNFRKKLWSSEKANEVMSKLMPYVDVCIANEEDAKDVFGIEAANSDINTGKISHEGYISVAQQLTDRFGFERLPLPYAEVIQLLSMNGPVCSIAVAAPSSQRSIRSKSWIEWVEATVSVVRSFTLCCLGTMNKELSILPWRLPA